MNKQHILFVHIPKTAGTSFRLAMQEWATEEHTFYDYGESSAETSKTILSHVYKDKDIYSLHKEMQKHEKLFFSGHFHVGKYMHLFKTTDVITFLRDPVYQVFSHYKHFKKYHGYTKTLEDFIKEERFCNFQSKMLQAKPLELFGFIGLVEEYALSIKIINFLFNTNLKVFTSNQINEYHDELSDELKKLIYKYNTKDVMLYKQAKKIFKDFTISYENKQNHQYYFIQQETENATRGISFFRNDALATVQNPQNHRMIQAKDLRPGMLVHNLPRNGYVGFEYKT